MFAPKTPLRLTGCNGKTVKDNDGGATRVVVLTFMAQPFTPDMANDLNVKARLFATSSGELIPEIATIGLKIAVPPQRLRLYEAPDMPRPSAEIKDVTIAPILSVRADKEGPVYAGTFNVQFSYPTAKELLWLFHRVTEQVFATFEAEQGSLPIEQAPTLSSGDEEGDAEEESTDED